MRKKNQNLRPIDAPIYNYWQAIYLSFYSPRLYMDVVKRWRGFGFLYLLFIIALASIPFSVRVIHGFDRYFHEEVTVPISKLPLLYVQNGQVIFDEPMPYLIKNKKGEVIDIIDTTGAVSDINALYPKLNLLITKYKIYSRYPKLNLFFEQTDEVNQGLVNVQTLNPSMNEVFNVQEWIKSGRLERLKIIIELLLYPTIVLILYGMYLVIMVVFGYTAIIFAQIVLKYKLKFKEGVRLFVVTGTPQVILFYIIFTLGLNFNGIGLIQLILLGLYFNYAVVLLKRDSKRLVNR